MYRDQNIPSIITKVFDFQEVNSEVIKYDDIIGLFGDQIISYPHFCNSFIPDYISMVGSSPDKCFYTEDELIVLLDEIYHITYIGDEKFNLPIVAVW